MGVIDEPSQEVNSQVIPPLYVAPSSAIQAGLVPVDPMTLASLRTAEAFGIPVRWIKKLVFTVTGARDIEGKNRGGFSDARCQFKLGGKSGQTKVIDKTNNPNWNEQFTFSFDATLPFPLITFQVYNVNVIFSDDLIGTATLDPRNLVLQSTDYAVVMPLEGARGELSVTIRHTIPQPDDFVFEVQHEFFSFGDFWIKDASGKKVFQVEGSWPNEFFFRDFLHRDLLHIKKRSFLAIEPTYDMYIPGEQAPRLSITKRIAFFGESFDIEGPYGNLTVQGDMFNWDYKFYDGAGRIVASVWAQMMQSYGVQIAADQELPLIIACVLIIDKTRKRR